MSDPSTRLAAALSDRYRIERELGAGGMATVYLAADLKHDRKVAIKVLKPELAAVLGAERFVVEIKTTAALSHPHILPLFDSGEAGGFLYYVMPYIEGETIREKLNRETQFGIEEALRITSEVADALDYAHRHGVIHRDIKPENILLHDGRPMVMDFGIALAVSAAAGGRMTETGLSLGTPHYMSPEQATADKAITARSDVYSLASVLYEMLAGEPPHGGDSAQAIIMKILTERPQPVTELRRSVPPNVAAALEKALEKVPADRFDSAKAFSDALGNRVFTSVAHAAAISRSADLRPFRSWIRSVWSWGALAGLLFLGVVASLRRHDTGAAVAGVVRFSVPVGPETSDSAAADFIPQFRLASQLAFSPDGSRLVYRAGSSGRASLYERRLDRPTEVLVAGSATESHYNPFFSPDGRWLGFLTRREGRDVLRRLTLADRSIETISPMDSIGGVVGLTWGDDGTIVAATTSRLYRIPALGGRWTLLAEVDSSPGSRRRWSQPHLLPGSRILLYHTAHSFDPQRAEIMALTLATGERRTVLADATMPIYAPGGILLFTRQATLMGVAFDPDRAEVRGDPFVLVSGVMQSLYGSNADQESGAAQVAFSAAGHLAYAPGAVGQPSRERAVRITTRGDTIPIPMESRDWVQFRFSPDGRQLAAVSRHGFRQQIWIHDMSRATTRQLATGGYSNWPVAWSPDGRWIAFAADRDQPGRIDLYRMPSDGSGTPELLFSSGTYDGPSDWSSQGAIAFVRYGGHGDIWVIPPDGEPKPFLATPAHEGWPAFSPDGRWLAYASNQSGRREVYIRPYPEGEPATLVSTSGGDSPMWSKDGRRLLYEDNGGLMAVDIASGPTLRLGSVRRYLAMQCCGFDPYRMTDVDADGSIVLEVPDPSAPPQPFGATKIEVILNFLEEMKRRVGQ